MSTLSRRGFLGAAGAMACAPHASARTLKTLGTQLYTVRSVINEKPLETLRAIENIGYREIEMVRDRIDQVWPSVKETKLKPVSMHLDTALFFADQAKLPAAIEDAKKRGFRYVVCPYVAPKDRGGADVMRRLADTLNRAGEQCRQLGMMLCYHNHAFEFEPSGSGTLLDVLMSATDRKLVGMEMDVMWVKVGGADPAALLKKYKGRVPLVHLKDVAKGTETRFNETLPKEAFKEAGNGVIDFAAVLRAAQASGVKHYFVEQDQTPGDPLDSLRQSYEFLSKLQF